MNQFERLISLIGKSKFEKLQKSHVLVVGLGGVGGNAVEALVRSGIGSLTVVDNDKFELSNLNRQILATHSSIGKCKADVCAQRCVDINKDVRIFPLCEKFSEQTKLDFSQFDYVVDAVDDVNAKLEIIKRATEAFVPVISCMGTAKKFDLTKLRVDDLYNSSVCPLASVMRKKCKQIGIERLKCVFSTEKPQKIEVLGSTAFVPCAAGILLAQTVVNDIIKD